VTQSSSSCAPLVFAAIRESRHGGIEAAALAADPVTLEVHSVFSGSIDPPDGSRPDVAPDAPRAMLHTELATGLGATLDRGVFVDYCLPDGEQRILDLLATGGRIIEFEGRIDLRSAATPILEAAGLAVPEWLDEAAIALGLPAPAPRALAQVRCALAVLQQIRNRAGVGEQWARLVGDEQKILSLAAQRLTQGRTVYGAWHLNDHRQYAKEAMEEAVDGFLYSMAALLRDTGGQPRRRYRVSYLATGLPADHPSVTAATRRLLSRNILAIYPDAVVAQLVQGGMSESDARSMLVEAADEVCVVGSATHSTVVDAVALAHLHRRLITTVQCEVMA
jgi:hypothetical protein